MKTAAFSRRTCALLVPCLLTLLSGHCEAAGSPLDPKLIVEFENTQLGHYFLVVDEAEARWIDQGGAGPGWVRTGESFWSESPMAWFYTGACRFYGSVSPGPNSHFFTADVGECEWLKILAASLPADAPKWNYEGFSFNVVPLLEG